MSDNRRDSTITMKKESHRRLLAAIANLLLAVMFSLISYLYPGMDKAVVRFASSLSVTQEASELEVVIVNIDTKSIHAIGPWPWERKVVGQLVEKIKQSGAKAIGINILFSGMTSDESDMSLVSAVTKTKSVVADLPSQQNKSLWHSSLQKGLL